MQPTSPEPQEPLSLKIEKTEADASIKQSLDAGSKTWRLNLMRGEKPETAYKCIAVAVESSTLHQTEKEANTRSKLDKIYEFFTGHRRWVPLKITQEIKSEDGKIQAQEVYVRVNYNSMLKRFKHIGLKAEDMNNVNRLSSFVSGEIKNIQTADATTQTARRDIAIKEVETYLNDKLGTAIEQKSLPDSVLLKFLQSVETRYNRLRASLPKETDDPIAAKIQELKDKIAKSEKSEPKSKELKVMKTPGEVLEHNKREVLDSAAIRDKLNRELQAAQGDAHLTHVEYLPPNQQPTGTLKGLEASNEQAFAKKLGQTKAEAVGKFGIAHAIGLRETMEDADVKTAITIKIDGKEVEIPLYGIFDGHGGADGAKFLANELPGRLQVNLEKAFQDPKFNSRDDAIFNVLKVVFAELTEEFRAKMKKKGLKGGTTACISLIIEGKLWTANLGDSRAFLNASGVAIGLSCDAELKTEEQERTVLKRGGEFVVNRGGDKRVLYRKNGIPINALNMSRSACEENISINPRPKIVTIPLDLLPPGPITLGIVCDGVSDVISTNNIVKYLDDHRDADLAEQAEGLAQEAHMKGTEDNVSALLVKLK